MAAKVGVLVLAESTSFRNLVHLRGSNGTAVFALLKWSAESQGCGTERPMMAAIHNAMNMENSGW